MNTSKFATLKVGDEFRTQEYGHIWAKESDTTAKRIQSQFRTHISPSADVIKEQAVGETAPNRFNGADYKGEFGIARWSDEEGDREIRFFTRKMVMVWKVSVTQTAPLALYHAAWNAAIEAANTAE